MMHDYQLMCTFDCVILKDRLNDVLKRWQEYRGLLQNTDQFLKEEFPYWLKDTDGDVPDSKNDAQRKMEGVKVSDSPA